MVYQGGKTRIVKYICPIIQKYINDNHIDTFIDAFVGGGSVIQNIKAKTRIGYDTNPYLIAVLNNLDKLDEISIPIQKKEYDYCRNLWCAHNHEEKPDWYVGLIGFIGSFSGKFYNGGWGKDAYNSSPGRSRHDEKWRNMKAQAPKIADCQFYTQSFFDLDTSGACIYCDPPYNSTTGYPYDDYDVERFWTKAEELATNNIVIVSELSAPKGWKEIWSKPIHNILNAASNTTIQTEKLFVRDK